MSNSSLEQDLKTYQDLIAILQEHPTPTEAQILNILLARDRIQTALTETYLITDNILNILQELDNILRKKQATIAPIIAKLHPDFNPDTKNWWWLLEAPKIDSSWHKYDLLANGASVTFLTISLGLIGEIGSRFLSGGSDILGGVLISFQSILTLLAAGGVLTKTGQETGKNLLARFGIQEQYWQEIGAGLSFLLMLSIWGLRLSLPTVATWYNHWGWSHYQKGDLSSAEEDYQRALSLNPDDAEAHFNLGLLYEELQDFDLARKEYILAIQGGEITTAINNLARLHILNKNYPAAVHLLLKAQSEPKLDQETQFAIWKNLGWARLKQGDIPGAETALLEAIKLDKNSAAPHCLLAQVKEAQNNQTEALKEWETCNQYANSLNPDEDSWRIQAQQCLANREKQKCSPNPNSSY